MTLVRFEITGDLKLGVRLEEFPSELHDELLSEINALGREAFDGAAASVPRRSGRLASMERLRIFDQPERVAAVVDFDKGSSPNDARKAGALEYGSRGEQIDIHAHMRRLEHAFHGQMRVLIGAHPRVPHVAEHSFVRSVTGAMRDEALARLQAIVSRTVDELNSED